MDRRRLVTLAVVALVVVGVGVVVALRVLGGGSSAVPPAERLERAEEKELPSVLDRAASELSARRSAWRANVTKASLAAARTQLGTCPKDPGWEPEMDGPLRDLGVDPKFLAREPGYVVARPAEALPDASAFGEGDAFLARVRDALAKGEATKTDLRTAHAIADGSWFEDRRGVVVVATNYRTPALHDSAYEGGVVEGRGYLVSVANNRIECAGDFAAKSSPEIDLRWWNGKYADPTERAIAVRKALDRDFERETRVAIRRTLLPLK